jgi:branched-chain amino acid transport system ATP-binding protein
MLKIQGIHVYYGLAPALKDVSLEVKDKEVVSVLGPNGAGKTTTVHAIMGVVKVKSGNIFFLNQEVTGKPPHQIVDRGISLVPEGRLLFPQMTVKENLNLGASTPKSRSKFVSSLESVFFLFPRLRERYSQLAGTLSGGEQQMLSIGRALMATPFLLILDEPSIGLAPVLVEDLFDRLQKLVDTGISILVVEQNAVQALRISDRAYVLELGEIVAVRPSSEFNSSEIISSYVGE